MKKKYKQLAQNESITAKLDLQKKRTEKQKNELFEMHDRKRQYKPNDYNVQCEENDEQIAKNKTHIHTPTHPKTQTQ